MAIFKSKNPFTPAQEIWLTQVILRDGATVSQAYHMLTGKKEGRPVDVPEAQLKYHTFRKRLIKLTGKESGNKATNSSVNESQLNPVDLSDIESQITWLSNFVNTTTNSRSGDRLRALGMLRELQDRIDATKPQTDSLAALSQKDIVREHTMLNDPHILTELIAMALAEFANDAEWCIDSLATWVMSLPKHRQQIVERIIAVHPMCILKDETQSEKLIRLRMEVEALTDEEIALISIEDINELRGIYPTDGADDED